MKLRWQLSHIRGYLALGMLRHAEAELRTVRPEDAEHSEVMGLRVALLHEKQSWRALRRLTAALVKREPDQAQWWVSLAFATRRDDSLEKAQEILFEAEKHHPREAVIQFNLGCYACLLGDLLEARLRVERAVELDPEFQRARASDPDLAALRALDEA